MALRLEIGKEYIIEHSRKGCFIGKVLSQSDEWVTVEVTKGRAHYTSILNFDRGIIGDEITIRKSFCTFQEAK